MRSRLEGGKDIEEGREKHKKEKVNIRKMED